MSTYEVRWRKLPSPETTVWDTLKTFWWQCFVFQRFVVCAKNVSWRPIINGSKTTLTNVKKRSQHFSGGKQKYRQWGLQANIIICSSRCFENEKREKTPKLFPNVPCLISYGQIECILWHEKDVFRQVGASFKTEYCQVILCMIYHKQSWIVAIGSIWWRSFQTQRFLIVDCL